MTTAKATTTLLVRVQVESRDLSQEAGGRGQSLALRLHPQTQGSEFSFFSAVLKIEKNQSVWYVACVGDTYFRDAGRCLPAENVPVD